MAAEVSNSGWSVAVAIPTTGRVDTLRLVLRSLADQTVLPMQVVIVDQSWTDRVARLCDGQAWPFVLSRVPVPWRSLAKSRNEAIRRVQSSTRWLLFLDDDAVPARNYLEELLRGAARHPEARILFGVIDNLTPSPTAYNAFARLTGLPYHGPRAGYRVLPSFKVTMDTNVSCDSPAEWATGCGFMVETSVFHFKTFDDRLAGYSFDEDVDFAFRVAKTGKRLIWCIPAARLTHLEAPTERPASRKLALMRTLYDVYLFWKNRHLGLSLWRFVLSEVAYTLAILVATLSRYKGNPYPLGPHLLSYCYVIKFWHQLRRGELRKVNGILGDPA